MFHQLSRCERRVGRTMRRREERFFLLPCHPLFFFSSEREILPKFLSDSCYIFNAVSTWKGKQNKKKCREWENRLLAVLANIELSGDPFFAFLHNFRIQTFYWTGFFNIWWDKLKKDYRTEAEDDSNNFVSGSGVCRRLNVCVCHFVQM